MQNIGYIQLLPIQILSIKQRNLNQNLFIQSPCGSGKTLSSILPYLINQQNENKTIIYISHTQFLKKQTAQFFTKLTKGITNIQVKDNDFDQNQNNIQIICCTAIEFNIALIKGLQFTKKTYLIVDEADYTIKHNLTIFQDMFNMLNTRIIDDQKITINDCLFCEQFKNSQLYYIMVSATLLQNKYIFNNLNLYDNNIIIYENNKQNTFIIIQNKQMETYKQIVDQIQEQNILLLFKQDFQKDKFIQLNKTNQLIFVEDDTPKLRGLDFEDLTVSVCYDSYQDIDNYIHSIGRCGRQGQKCIHYIITDKISQEFYEQLQQIGQIQMFQSYEDYVEKTDITNKMMEQNQ